ncbi:MAG: hypothetical protein R3B70_27285 [Polyangiaceae bacterium]
MVLVRSAAGRQDKDLGDALSGTLDGALSERRLRWQRPSMFEVASW